MGLRIRVSGSGRNASTGRGRLQGDLGTEITALAREAAPDTTLMNRCDEYWCDALGYPVGAHAEVVLTVKATVSHRDGDHLVLTTADGEKVRVLPGVVQVLTSRRWRARAGQR